MGFAFFFFIAWLITVGFTVMKKRLTFLENSFVFFLLLIISINWSWIIYEELKLEKISTHPIDYTAFMINRSVTIPLMIVVTLNLVKSAKTKLTKTLLCISSILVLVFLIMMGSYFDLTQSIKWNIMYDILYFAILHLIALYSLKYFRTLKRNEV